MLSLMGKICAKFKVLGRVLKQIINREKTDEEIIK
jgi:hypothetical protein